jgi:hypothetical protein
MIEPNPGYECVICKRPIDDSATYRFIIDLKLFKGDERLGSQWFFSHVGCFRGASSRPEMIDEMMERLVDPATPASGGTA